MVWRLSHFLSFSFVVSTLRVRRKFMSSKFHISVCCRNLYTFMFSSLPPLPQILFWSQDLSRCISECLSSMIYLPFFLIGLEQGELMPLGCLESSSHSKICWKEWEKGHTDRCGLTVLSWPSRNYLKCWHSAFKLHFGKAMAPSELGPLVHGVLVRPGMTESFHLGGPGTCVHRYAVGKDASYVLLCLPWIWMVHCSPMWLRCFTLQERTQLLHQACFSILVHMPLQPICGLLPSSVKRW